LLRSTCSCVKTSLRMPSPKAIEPRPRSCRTIHSGAAAFSPPPRVDSGALACSRLGLGLGLGPLALALALALALTLTRRAGLSAEQRLVRSALLVTRSTEGARQRVAQRGVELGKIL
jgi:hypothetical protein